MISCIFYQFEMLNKNHFFHDKFNIQTVGNAKEKPWKPIWSRKFQSPSFSIKNILRLNVFLVVKHKN